MSLLFLDTAMNACSAAVEHDGVITSRTLHIARGQAEQLIPLAKMVMEESGAAFDTLEAIAVTVGPGTFTGLRVGMAAAKGFSLSLNVPMLAMTTTEILAAQVAKERDGNNHTHDGALAIVIETKRSDFYIQLFNPSCAAGGCTPLGEAQALEISQMIALYGSMTLAFYGDAVERLQRDLGQEATAIPSSWTFHPEILVPDPSVALTIARARMQAPDNGDNRDNGDIQPVYLRGADVSQPKIKRTIKER